MKKLAEAPGAKIPLLVVMMCCVVFVGSCSSNAPAGPQAFADQCDRSLPATGEMHRIAHPRVASACQAVVMMCNYCQYDRNGAFERAGSDPCGVCIGADF